MSYDDKVNLTKFLIDFASIIDKYHIKIQGNLHLKKHSNIEVWKKLKFVSGEESVEVSDALNHNIELFR